jgi:hypothetical protein
MQCQGCHDSKARYKSVHGYFCGRACQSRHWALLGEEERSRFTELVRVERVNLRRAALSKEDMGRAWWVALHSLANSLEDDTNDEGKLPLETQQQLNSFIGLVTRLYPCGLCKNHFREMVQRTPPRVETALDFQRWLSDRHNEVNARLGKPLISFEQAERLECESST